jgi:hypothetical protein
MPSSKSPNSPSARKRHARRAPTTPHLPALRRVQQPQKQTEYISGMKKGDRVYHVLKDLRDKHRWSLKDFILHLVTEESTIKGSHTCAMHTKNLSSAIYQQEAVAKQLSKVSGDIWTTTNSQQVSRIRSELGKVGKPEVGLGKFDPDQDVGALDIPALARRIQKAAPELFKLLADLMVQQHSSGHITSTDSHGSLVMVCSILARAYAPRNCNNFPVLLGLHLHSMGVKRRTLEVLSGLGVSASYWEINKQSGNVAENGTVQSLFLRNSPYP